MASASEGQEDMDSATKIWGALRNQEQMQQLGLNKPDHRSRDKKRPKTGDNRPDRQSKSSSTTEVPTDLLQQLVRLTLRHEDSINCLMQESQFMVHMSPGKGSIVPHLLKASQTWHASTDKTISLRHHLALTMMQTLEMRLKKLCEATPTEDLFVDCMKYHLICNDNDRTMPYLRWSPKTQSLHPTETPGLPILEVQRTLSNVLRIMSDPLVTLRFHALKKQKEGGEQKEAIPWLWTVSMRTAPELWCELRHLSYHSIWQLIQVRLTATRTGATTLSQAITEGNVNLIPIFENHNGSICFANTVILCLAWMTLMADGFHPQQWTTGFELLRRVFQAEHRPVDLLTTDPFLWLLMGTWTVESLHRQQDVSEFAIYFLSLLQPKFLHCGWVTRVSLTAEPANDVLASEKGHQFMPILLRYVNFQDDTSQLQELVMLWHDSQGEELRRLDTN
jgi:hypothetical protein